MDYWDIKWFALETKRDHSVVFEITSKYCISESYVDYDGYSISSKGFLPAVVDIMVRMVVFAIISEIFFFCVQLVSHFNFCLLNPRVI